MTKKERLEFLIKHFADGKKTKFAEMLGISAQGLSSWLSRGTYDIELVYAKCEGVSAEWLMTGEGEIFDTKNVENVDNLDVRKFVDNFVDKPKVQKTSTNKEIDLSVKNDEVYTFINRAKGKNVVYPTNDRNGVIIGDVQGAYTADPVNTNIIPIVDVNAAAGHGAVNPDYIDKTDIIAMPPAMLQKGFHNAIRIKGPSMAPTLQDGSYLISRLLDRSEWVDIKDDYIYVVTNTEGETYVKRLKNRLREHGFIVCMSDNPDKATFPNFNLMEGEIHNVWFVEWYLSARMPNIHATYYNKLQEHDDEITEIKMMLDRLLKKN